MTRAGLGRARLVAAAVATCAVWLASGGAPAHAQDAAQVEAEAHEASTTPPPTPSPAPPPTPSPATSPTTPAKPLSLMTRDELAQAGFVFEDASQARSRATGTLLSGTAGLVASGIGHWWIGDSTTAAVLSGMKLGGFSLVGTGAMLRAWGDAPRTASTAIFMGTGLLLHSYLIDVLGTAYSDELGLPPNTLRPQGVSIAARYSFRNIESLAVRHLLGVEVGLDPGHFYTRLNTIQDVWLNMSSYGGAVGWRPWRGARPWTFAFVELDANHIEWRNPRALERLDLGAHAGVSLDLGELFRHLQGFAFGVRVGYARRFYALYDPVTDEAGDWKTSLTYLPMEMFAHVNLNDSLNMRVEYARRRDHFLQTTQSILDVPAVEFTYRSTNKLELVFRGEYGSGFAFTGGFKLWIWE